MASDRREIWAKPYSPACHAQHEELHKHETGKEGVGHAGIGGEQLRSGLQAVNDEAAHEHCGHGLAGDAQGQGGDERAAGHGVVGRLGTRHAFDGALAEFILVLGEAAGLVIAHGPRRQHSQCHDGDDDKTSHLVVFFIYICKDRINNEK